MYVKFQKLHPDAQEPVKRKTQSDFCYDVATVTDGEPVYDDDGNLIPNVIKYRTGLALEIVRDVEKLGVKTRVKQVGTDKETGLPDMEVVDELITFDFTNSNFILDIDGRPRSSVYNTGLVLCNCEATIDEAYTTGEIAFMFYDVVPSLPKYKKGDYIAQIKLGLTLPMEFVESKQNTINVDRGSDGWGSSDKKKKK